MECNFCKNQHENKGVKLCCSCLDIVNLMKYSPDSALEMLRDIGISGKNQVEKVDDLGLWQEVKKSHDLTCNSKMFDITNAIMSDIVKTFGISIQEFHAELDRANELYPLFVSNHEGYAVILEMRDETDPEKQRVEAIQLGAMCLKFQGGRCGRNS